MKSLPPQIVVGIMPDSFKGTLSSAEAAAAVARGLERAAPGFFRCIGIPLADGGEGTVEAIVKATQGRFVRRKVEDPLGRRRFARFGLTGDGKTAVIEVAAASGLPLLSSRERNPLDTSTYGTGELMRSALACGVKRIVVGLGGSATVDGGAGAAAALGIRLLDARGVQIPRGGAGLCRLSRIVADGRDVRMGDVEVVAACDVDNPLTGRDGAARVYAPQKGADAEQVRILESGLRRLARIAARDLGVELADLRRGGAAGGLGAGMKAFFGASLVSGVDVVLDVVDARSRLKGCHLLITGEGCVDSQTARGKAPQGVARLADAMGVPVIAICGVAGSGYTAFRKGSVSGVFPSAGFQFSAPAPGQFSASLSACAEEVGRLLRLGMMLA